MIKSKISTLLRKRRAGSKDMIHFHENYLNWDGTFIQTVLFRDQYRSVNSSDSQMRSCCFGFWNTFRWYFLSRKAFYHQLW